MIKFLSIGLFFFSVATYSQQKEKAIEDLIDNYARTISSSPDSAFYYISKATEASKKLKSDYYLSRCFYNLGYHYYLQNDLEKSQRYLLQSLPYAKKAQNAKIQALAYNQLGLIDMEKSDFNASLKKLLLSLKIANQNQLTKNECNALNNLGLLYLLQKDTLKTLGFYKQNERIAIKNDFKDILLSTYGNMAILKRDKNKKEAIFYYSKAYLLAKELNDKYEEFNILINLSDLFLSLNNKESYAKAFKYIQEAKKSAIEMGNNQNLFFVYFNLGGYQTKMKNYKEALFMYKKALALSREGVDDNQKVNLYEALSTTNEKWGDFKQAYFYKKKQSVLKDLLYNIEKNKGFNEIQTKYEVEKKNLKIKLLLKEKLIEQNRKKLILIISISLLVSLVLVILFFKNRINTQKIIAQKENQLFLQEKERLLKEQELEKIVGVLEGQKLERSRIAKEIHDGIGGKLAGIKLSLSQVNAIYNNEKLHILIDNLSNVFKELREISHNLSLNFLKEKSLAITIKNVLLEYQNRGEFNHDLTIFPEGSLEILSFEIKHQLYRIIQELLTNISKHAKAKKVILSITVHDEFLNLIIEDDGVGFSENNTKGIGLNNIEERLSMLKGDIKIESVPQKGTIILIDIPIKTV
jgi:two-component system, NarL family, sensor kinase